MEESVHAPVGQNYRVNLGEASPPSACQPLLAEALAAQEGAAFAPLPAPGLQPAATRQVAVLEGVTEFDVVSGGGCGGWWARAAGLANAGWLHLD